MASRESVGPALRKGTRSSKSSFSDRLAALQVIDRLEVGPVRLERARFSAAYRVTLGGRTHTKDLIYRYEEDVFDPADPSALNLASMIAAQLALNYGMFCKRIAFHGPYDDADRGFLAEFARNTSREIYVNKLLAPNPFLRPPATDLPAQRRETYLLAELTFEDKAPARATPWSVSSSRHGVLSSGGKDSLLTYGLLEELGLEPHAIFLNESGRHWYTAINAYRHLAGGPRTHRVWTNSDRLFNWMLRHLSFIRPDFGEVRADFYPIRLWTVAVFLFGALPLARQRGIGRLLVGDEYDTSVRRTTRGIPHHAGLFDQSRWFDNAMTRYFQRKGWGLCQFSVLRQLSELLIEKILVERYPELQRHQVSCHAATLRGGRARPCGRCEKCRRIVGMLVALDNDPTACGYTPEQVERCLADLTRHHVHQEASAAEHMIHLLAQKGRIESLDTRAHPEVLKMRFHQDFSPCDVTPNDLRKPLHRILAEHAQGAVERQGRIWIPCNPLAESVLARPYPFHVPGRGGPATEPATEAGPRKPYLLGELTWKEARTRLKEVDIALLPVGAIEQHGPHLPLDTDAFDADCLARRVAAACRPPAPLVLPVIPYGVSYHHEDFPGTLSVSPETLAQFVYEIGLCVASHGITKLIIINGHGGNGPALHLAAQRIDRDARIFTCVDTGETSDADVDALIESENDVHAGEIETSTCLAVRPELVKMDKAPRMVARFSSRYLDFTSKRSVVWYTRTAKISASGVLGDATKASREKGEKIWDIMVSRLVEFVEDLKSLSLDEIYQKRY